MYYWRRGSADGCALLRAFPLRDDNYARVAWIMGTTMAAVHVPAVPRVAAARSAYADLLGALAIGVFVIAFGVLGSQPVATLDRASGLYNDEGDANHFRWTSSTAEF